MKCPKCHTENPDDSKYCRECAASLATVKDISFTVTLKAPSAGFSKGAIIAGKYEIIGKIGEGGMGVVYKAKDTRLDRILALKFLSSDLSRDPEARARFVQEAQAAAILEHPNICTVFEADEADGKPFIAMSFLQGRTLKERLNAGPLGVDEALDIAVQVAEGLQEAHEAGIVHRDIKPANIMITDKGQAKITDFGLAKLSGGVDITKTSVLMGTLAYMSPEQARGEAVDTRSDIWALGAMLYEMLAGERPFEKDRHHAVIYDILHEEPKALSVIRPDVPEHIQRAVRNAMIKDKEHRCPDIPTLLSDMRPPSLSVPTHSCSIAVLPFADMSARKDQEYFCDGLSESIINSLTQIDECRVVARTSAFAFKGKNADIRDIGKRLNVGHVLEGSVQIAGDRLRITAQLINVKDGYHLWSERFDSTLDDVFTIQDEISLKIVDKLKIKLGIKDAARLIEHETQDIDAYNLYLQGRHHWSKVTKKGCEKALDYFHQVISKDPTYARAYAGIAHCHLRNAWYHFLPPRNELPKAKSFAEQALALDESLTEAYSALGIVKMAYDRDWDGAGFEFRRAVEVSRGDSTDNFYHSVYFSTLGKHDDAIRQAQHALESDPISLMLTCNLGMRYYYARRFETSLSIIQKAIELDPNSYIGHWYSSFPLMHLGRYQEAVSAIQRAMVIEGQHTPQLIMGLGLTHALSGNLGEAERSLDALIRVTEKEGYSMVLIALVLVAMDRFDEAFDWMERAFDEYDIMMIWIKSDPDFDKIRSDPRYALLIRRAGLA